MFFAMERINATRVNLQVDSRFCVTTFCACNVIKLQAILKSFPIKPSRSRKAAPLSSSTFGKSFSDARQIFPSCLLSASFPIVFFVIKANLRYAIYRILFMWICLRDGNHEGKLILIFLDTDIILILQVKTKKKQKLKKNSKQKYMIKKTFILKNIRNIKNITVWWFIKLIQTKTLNFIAQKYDYLYVLLRHRNLS